MGEVLPILVIQLLLTVVAGITYLLIEHHKARNEWRKSIDEYEKARQAIAKYQDVHNQLTQNIASMDQRVNEINNKVSIIQIKAR